MRSYISNGYEKFPAPVTSTIEPLISIALVTRNRLESLRRTLLSLRAQDVQPAEVMVSDDSDDAIAGDVKNLASELDCRYLRGPRRGLYANRNAAARACSGTHVRSMDDDHEFPPNHFAACVDGVIKDPEAVWIIGEFTPSNVRAGEPDCPGQLTPRGFSETPNMPDRSWALACGASIFPKSLFNRGILNAEHFRFGASYLEFGSRLHWLGYRIRFLRETHIVHHLDMNNRSFMDIEEDLSARMFAMLCHSFIYQPRIANVGLTVGEIAKLLLLHKTKTLRSLPRSISAFLNHRPEVMLQKRMNYDANEPDHLAYSH